MSENPQRDEVYEEFMRMFLRDEKRLFAYVRSLVRQYADAEDVHQRCSLTLWRRFHEFDRERMFLPWACRIAFNEVRNFYRVSSRDKLRFTDALLESMAEERMSDLDASQERLGALANCIAELRDADRELIRAAYHDERLLAEIAASIGKALQTVYNRLSVLRRKLLDCVENKVIAGGGQA